MEKLILIIAVGVPLIIIAVLLAKSSNEKPQHFTVNNESSSSNDNRSFSIAVLSFIIPLAGLILWIVWKDDESLKSQSARNGALLSISLIVVLS